MKALIIGVTGQDGAYLSKYLLKKGYEVIGTSRNLEKKENFSKLITFNLLEQINLEQLNIKNYKEVRKVIKKYNPDEIYNLSGQTSVSDSFKDTLETCQSIFNGTLNILESIKNCKIQTKFFNAGSGEIFGGNDSALSNESSTINPLSPYAAAKASSLHLVDVYRNSFDIFCVTGIAFNHESPLRPENFVTQKIVKGATEIFKGNKKKLTLGNMDISRDWGWAPEYVEAMNAMLTSESPKNYVISTGKLSKLSDFVELAFSYFDLDWKNHVEYSDQFKRPSDVIISGGDPSLVSVELNWSHRLSLKQIVEEMCKAAYM